MALRAFISAGAACRARREPGWARREPRFDREKPAKNHGIATALRRYIPYWALNFIVLLLAVFSKPMRGRFADPRAAGARLSTARYQFKLT